MDREPPPKKYEEEGLETKTFSANSDFVTPNIKTTPPVEPVPEEPTDPDAMERLRYEEHNRLQEEAKIARLRETIRNAEIKGDSKLEHSSMPEETLEEIQRKIDKLDSEMDILRNRLEEKRTERRNVSEFRPFKYNKINKEYKGLQNMLDSTYKEKNRLNLLFSDIANKKWQAEDEARTFHVEEPEKEQYERAEEREGRREDDLARTDDLRNQIRSSYDDEEGQIMPEGPRLLDPEYMRAEPENKHPRKRFWRLNKMPKELKKEPEGQVLWLQEEIAKLREENERMRRENYETANGVLDAIKRTPKRFLNSVTIEWNGGKVVDLLKKLRRLEGKIERKNKKYTPKEMDRGYVNEQHASGISEEDLILERHPEFLKNPFKIRKEELILAYQVHAENLQRLFQSYEEWESIARAPVDQFLRFRQQHPLYRYIHQLHNISKLKPKGGGMLFGRGERETVNEYMARAVQKVAQMRRLEEIRLN